MRNIFIDPQFGRRVKALRRTEGLSQEQLAEAIDRTVETVSNIERGKTSTGLDVVYAIAKALKVEPALLFGEPLPPKREHPVIEELVELLAGADAELLGAVLDQAKIMVTTFRRAANTPRRASPSERES